MPLDPIKGKPLKSINLLIGVWGLGPQRVQGSALASLALLSALLVYAMIRVAILDTPGHRSSHDRPTPKGGGVGVVVSFLVGMAILHPAVSLMAAVALLALVSWLDDVRQFPPMVKLAAQVAASVLVLSGTHLPLWGLTVGFAWLMFATNALNFIDGLNGLAAGSMALASLFIGLTAPNELEAVAGCVLAAGLVGFLPFNYPRAAIFLGDVGSQAAGMAVAALGLLRWQDPVPGSVLVMPLLLSGILFDVAFTLCRRLLAGDRLTEAHRGHLYQLAFRSGMPAPLVTLLHWGFVLWGGGLAWLLSHTLLMPWLAVSIALLPQLAWSGFIRRRAKSVIIGRW